MVLLTHTKTVFIQGGPEKSKIVNFYISIFPYILWQKSFSLVFVFFAGEMDIENRRIVKAAISLANQKILKLSSLTCFMPGLCLYVFLLINAPLHQSDIIFENCSVKNRYAIELGLLRSLKLPVFRVVNNPDGTRVTAR